MLSMITSKFESLGTASMCGILPFSLTKSFENFIVNMLGAIAAYCMFPKKPCI